MTHAGHKEWVADKYRFVWQYTTLSHADVSLLHLVYARERPKCHLRMAWEKTFILHKVFVLFCSV